MRIHTLCNKATIFNLWYVIIIFYTNMVLYKINITLQALIQGVDGKQTLQLVLRNIKCRADV